MNRNNDRFEEDWAALFKLLEEGKIKPVIAQTLPILEAAQHCAGLMKMDTRCGKSL